MAKTLKTDVYVFDAQKGSVKLAAGTAESDIDASARASLGDHVWATEDGETAEQTAAPVPDQQPEPAPEASAEDAEGDKPKAKKAK